MLSGKRWLGPSALNKKPPSFFNHGLGLIRLRRVTATAVVLLCNAPRSDSPIEPKASLHELYNLFVKHSITFMVKSISKIGNSHGIIFDSALLEMARLKPGDQVNVEVHSGGTITLTPLRAQPSREEVSKTIKATMKDYARTMKKLA